MRIKNLLSYAVVLTIGLFQLNGLSAINLKTMAQRSALKKQVLTDIKNNNWIDAANGIDQFTIANLERFAIDLREIFANAYSTLTPGNLPANWPASLKKSTERQQAKAAVASAIDAGKFNEALAGIQKLPKATSRELYKKFTTAAVSVEKKAHLAKQNRLAQEKVAKAEQERLKNLRKNKDAIRAQQAAERKAQEQNRLRINAERQAEQNRLAQEKATQAEQERLKNLRRNEDAIRAQQAAERKAQEQNRLRINAERQAEQNRLAQEKATQAEQERLKNLRRNEDAIRAQQAAELKRETLAQATAKAATEASKKREQTEEERTQKELRAQEVLAEQAREKAVEAAKETTKEREAQELTRIAIEEQEATKREREILASATEASKKREQTEEERTQKELRAQKVLAEQAREKAVEAATKATKEREAQELTRIAIEEQEATKREREILASAIEASKKREQMEEERTQKELRAQKVLAEQAREKAVEAATKATKEREAQELTRIAIEEQEATKREREILASAIEASKKREQMEEERTQKELRAQEVLAEQAREKAVKAAKEATKEREAQELARIKVLEKQEEEQAKEKKLAEAKTYFMPILINYLDSNDDLYQLQYNYREKQVKDIDPNSLVSLYEIFKKVDNRASERLTGIQENQHGDLYLAPKKGDSYITDQVVILKQDDLNSFLELLQDSLKKYDPMIGIEAGRLAIISSLKPEEKRILSKRNIIKDLLEILDEEYELVDQKNKPKFSGPAPVKRDPEEEQKIKDSKKAQEGARSKLFAAIRDVRDKKEPKPEAKKEPTKEYFANLLSIHIDQSEESYELIKEAQKEIIHKFDTDALTALYDIFIKIDHLAKKGASSGIIETTSGEFYLKTAADHQADEISKQITTLQENSSESQKLLATLKERLELAKPKELTFQERTAQFFGLRDKLSTGEQQILGKLNVIDDLLKIFKGESLIERLLSDSDSDDSDWDSSEDEKKPDSEDDSDSEDEDDSESEDEDDSDSEDEIPEPEDFGGGFGN